MAMYATRDSEAGNSIGRRIADLETKLGGEPGSDLSEDYKQLPQTMTALEQALETAIRIDEEKSTSFWQEVGEFFDHGLGYWADKRRFEDEVRQLVERARANMRALREHVDVAIEMIPVPDDLAHHVEGWRRVARQVEPAMDEVPNLRRAPGWSGHNADTYGTMVDVQTQASAEYRPMPSMVADTVDRLRALNQWLLRAAYSSVAAAKNQSSRCVAGGPNEFYVNTANVNAAVEHCLQQLPAEVRSAQRFGSEMSTQLDEVRTTPVVIQGGWPRGTGQAGQRARVPVLGDMRVTDTLDSVPTAPVPHASGVER